MAKREKWIANINEVPGLRADLNKQMLKSGSLTHAELLSRMSFAYEHTKTWDKIFKLMLKPDDQCSKIQLKVKGLIIKAYHFSGTSTQEVSEEILMEIATVYRDNIKDDSDIEKDNLNKETDNNNMPKGHIEETD